MTEQNCREIVGPTFVSYERKGDNHTITTTTGWRVFIGLDIKTLKRWLYAIRKYDRTRSTRQT